MPCMCVGLRPLCLLGVCVCVFWYELERQCPSFISSAYAYGYALCTMVAMPSSTAPFTHGQSAGGDDVNSGTKRALPTFPGDNSHAHQGRSWIESANARLSGMQLLAVAEGHEPAAAAQIVDTYTETIRTTG